MVTSKKKYKKALTNEQREKLKVLKERQADIFDYCKAHNVLEIILEMMNRIFLSNEENPTLIMANYLLTLTAETTEEQCIKEMVQMNNVFESLKTKFFLKEDKYLQLQRQLDSLKRRESSGKMMQSRYYVTPMVSFPNDCLFSPYKGISRFIPAVSGSSVPVDPAGPCVVITSKKKMALSVLSDTSDSETEV